MHKFAKDKSPSPDGWTVEFFLAFFDILGKDLLEVAGFSRKKGYRYGALNDMFITLIHKKDNPNFFSDFRSISLCNMVYKLVTKIIVDRLNPFL